MQSAAKKWVPKDQETAPKLVPEAAGSSKGRLRQGGAGKNGKGGSTSNETTKRGPKQSRVPVQTTDGGSQQKGPVSGKASSQMSKDEVQQGLSMLLQQLKGTSQDDTYGSTSPWTPEKKGPEPGAALLRQLQSGPKPTGQKKKKKFDIGSAYTKKRFGRGLLLRARACMLGLPGGLDSDGPKWGVATRPLELSTNLEFDTPVTGIMPPTPPPAGPPSFRASSTLMADAPVFEPAPAWDVAANGGMDDGYHTSMNGFVAADGTSLPWEAHMQQYYDCDGMLPEVPAWPFDYVNPSMPPSYSSTAYNGLHQNGKAEGLDLEDVESTAASSGQPSSVSLSPIHVSSEVQARVQVEYYLSPENLVRDVFLRSNLDEEGWVSLEVLASFPRMRQIGVDASGVAAALMGSTFVEVSRESPLRVRTISPELRAKFLKFVPVEGTSLPAITKEEQPATQEVGTAC
jgi:hypothetical protein